jgi:uncharacterized protein
MLVSIHDVSPKFLPEIDTLRALIGRDAAGAKPALLVVPNHWRDAPIADDVRFGTWLRQRHAEGCEILLHGWFHRDDTPARTALARFKGAHLTAGEGEFLNLDEATAGRRLRDGRMLIEDMIGAPVTGFVAPAWLYGPGARAALVHTGFAFAEDHFRVWSPIDGARLATGPVISWATRTPLRKASSLAFAALARPLLGASRVVRIAAHPGDARSPAVMASIGRTLRHFARTHRATRYDALRAAAAGTTPIRPLPLPQEQA